MRTLLIRPRPVPCPRLPWACSCLGGFLLALAAWVAPAARLAAEEPAGKPAAKQPEAKKKASSLDDELLRGLGDDPLKDLGAKPAAPEPAGPAKDTSPGQQPRKPKPAVTPLDEDLLRNLEGGEDRAAGDADSNDPLVRLNHQMRQAEELLRARKSGDPTQKLQDKIVGELEELIKQLRQQQQQQQSSSSSSGKKPQQTAKRESVSQPQQQKGSATGAKPNPKPARDSSQRVGKAEVKTADPGKLSDMIKDIWGELPARLRQQMMQSSAEQFVPKYELQIEEYFKTLSEKRQEK